MPENRNETGQFKKGVSGNPGGRPAVAQEFKERCREFMTEQGFDRLVGIATDNKDKDRFRALELIAGYAIGKPKQGIEWSGEEEGGNIQIVIEPASKYIKTDQ